MTDALAITSERQRQIVFAALLAYVALFVASLSTGSPLASAGADLLIGLLVLAAGVVGYRRAAGSGEADPVMLTIITSLLIAGLTSIYGALATLSLVQPVPVVETLGSIALIVAVVLYFFSQQS
jgi:lysylphosphatidylglycerol synthetase-like protein (DUF2156 family)